MTDHLEGLSRSECLRLLVYPIYSEAYLVALRGLDW